MRAGDHFRLGVFAPNCSSGLSITTAPERWRNDWPNNLALAHMLDDAGIDFMLPIARWIGYGGETNFHGNVLDPTVWATAILASTQNISVFSTVHTACNHPVVVAKQLATMNEIAPGRAGLNIVAGWNKPEYEALGLDLSGDHADRYGYAQEWFDVIQALWSREGKFDWQGDHFRLTGIEAAPQPGLGRIPILNAAGSGEGRDFAVRNADFLFTPAIELDRSAGEVAELRAKADAAGRASRVLTLAHVVCRPTLAEAEDYVARYVDALADWEATDNLVALMFTHAQSFPADVATLIRNRFAMGHGGYPLVGTPEMVADGLEAIQAAGFAGTTLSFVDYVAEFPYFRDAVLPKLEARGMRAPRLAIAS